MGGKRDVTTTMITRVSHKGKTKKETKRRKEKKKRRACEEEEGTGKGRGREEVTEGRRKRKARGHVKRERKSRPRDGPRHQGARQSGDEYKALWSSQARHSRWPCSIKQINRCTWRQRSVSPFVGIAYLGHQLPHVAHGTPFRHANSGTNNGILILRTK